jgi:hypothetical protein
MLNVDFKPCCLRSRRVDSCGSSWSGETPQERSDEEAQRHQRRICFLKKLAIELFHNSSPAESEAPGTKINSHV